MDGLLMQPPKFPSISEAMMNSQRIKGMEIQNLLGQQQLEMNPEKLQLQQSQMKLQESTLQLKQMALDIQEKAMEAKGKKNISLSYDWGTIEGSPDDILNVSALVAKYPDQVKDPNFMPWIASQGVSIKPGAAKPEDKVGSELTEFEYYKYGKLVPTLRGTPDYQKERLKYIKEKREESPMAKALERQIDVQSKKEGTGLRKEFNDLPETKTYTDVKQKYEIMGEAIKESKVTKSFLAVDQALITLFNKMTDPQSVVRESEYARTPQDMAIWNRLKGKIEKWKSGGAGLTQEDREALHTMGGKFLQVSEKKYKERLHEYRGYISSYGLDANKYLTPYGKKSTEEETPERPPLSSFVRP